MATRKKKTTKKKAKKTDLPFVGYVLLCGADIKKMFTPNVVSRKEEYNVTPVGTTEDGSIAQATEWLQNGNLDMDDGHVLYKLVITKAGPLKSGMYLEK